MVHDWILTVDRQVPLIDAAVWKVKSNDLALEFCGIRIAILLGPTTVNGALSACQHFIVGPPSGGSTRARKPCALAAAKGLLLIVGDHAPPFWTREAKSFFVRGKVPWILLQSRPEVS